jgi:hypothetical protein
MRAGASRRMIAAFSGSRISRRVSVFRSFCISFDLDFSPVNLCDSWLASLCGSLSSFRVIGDNLPLPAEGENGVSMPMPSGSAALRKRQHPPQILSGSAVVQRCPRRSILRCASINRSAHSGGVVWLPRSFLAHQPRVVFRSTPLLS